MFSFQSGFLPLWKIKHTHIDFRISDRNKNTGGKIEAALLTLELERISSMGIIFSYTFLEYDDKYN